MIALERVLVGTDFSDASEVALRYGRALAEAFQGTLHVLHVMEEVVAHAWLAEAYMAALPRVYEEMERAARERLSALVTETDRRALQARTMLRTGAPFVEIITYAREEQIDLIVLGTHGRGALAHMMMGSVAEKVVRKAPCPVLTVRPTDHRFVAP